MPGRHDPLPRIVKEKAVFHAVRIKKDELHFFDIHLIDLKAEVQHTVVRARYQFPELKALDRDSVFHK